MIFDKIRKAGKALAIAAAVAMMVGIAWGEYQLQMMEEESDEFKEQLEEDKEKVRQAMEVIERRGFDLGL